jgi:hypothetical protein
MLRRTDTVWRATHLTSGLVPAHWRKTVSTMDDAAAQDAGTSRSEPIPDLQKKG